MIGLEPRRHVTFGVNVKSLIKDTYNVVHACWKSERIYFPEEVVNDTPDSSYEYYIPHTEKRLKPNEAKRYLRGSGR